MKSFLGIGSMLEDFGNIVGRLWSFGSFVGFYIFSKFFGSWIRRIVGTFWRFRRLVGR